MVQCTTFGDTIEMVANFGTAEFADRDTRLGRESILVKRRDSGRVQARADF
jgi:hypothetical protein